MKEKNLIKKIMICAVCPVVAGVATNIYSLAYPAPVVIDTPTVLYDDDNPYDTDVLSLTAEQEDVDAQIEDKTDMLVQLMAEQEVLSADIDRVNEEIETATDDLAKATALEEEQYAAMLVRIKYLYEAGDTSLISIYIKTGSFAEAVTLSDYYKDLYEYDRNMLSEYQSTVAEVTELKSYLEAEKADLEKMMVDYETQSSELEASIEELKEISDNYEIQIANAKARAAAYASMIEAQKAAAAQAAAQAAAAQAAQNNEPADTDTTVSADLVADAGDTQDTDSNVSDDDNTDSSDSGNSDSGSTAPAIPSGGSSTITTTKGATYDVSPIYGANGSDLGKQIAVYACQFIGNPYRAGGTSLTDGSDCSGFTMTIYSIFGYSLPRTSYDQRFIGTEVSYADAQPGDIICYSGHVAIYIGNGQIVHASTPSGGIKVGSATYTSIITVRRII